MRGRDRGAVVDMGRDGRGRREDAAGGLRESWAELGWEEVAEYGAGRPFWRHATEFTTPTYTWSRPPLLAAGRWAQLMAPAGTRRSDVKQAIDQANAEAAFARGHEPSEVLARLAHVDPDKQHKPRTVKTQPAAPAAASPPPVPLQLPVATTVAVPLSVPMWQLPFAAVSPLPMQHMGYFPPRF